MKAKIVKVLLFLLLAGLLSLSLPVEEAPSGGSRVLLDRGGGLLRVWRDEEGQYRFPADGRYAEKYKKAVVFFEDKRFAFHPGVDPLSVLRAMWQNLRAGRIVSGASTLSMQAARLRSPRARTWWAKLAEAHRALRMEWQWGKARVFAEYASLAPMGGNVVGAETACWRFFGHGSAEMTWAEASLLAVLPNRPSALNLAREREGLKKRRDALLGQLAEAGKMDALELSCALGEPLPLAASPWRFRAPHYAEAMASRYGEARLRGTLDAQVQATVERLAEAHGRHLLEQSAVNVAVLVMETSSGRVRGYLGSLAYFDTLARGMVDGVQARRSTGSTLKPFLYGLAMARGPYQPSTLLPDVPAWYGGFHPENSDQQYSGLVPMQEALARSLNVPAVGVLKDYGLEEFHHWLGLAGLKLIRSPSGYGLPLILGGAEASLAELAPLYAMLMNDGLSTPPRWLEDGRGALPRDTLLPPGAAYAVRSMLTSLQRPDLDMYHAWFDHQVPVAWKTGTSYGSRDGWAIGANRQWTIGVWVGNMRGGEVPGLSGGASAAPLLFSLFNSLSDRSRPLWPDKPASRYFEEMQICQRSGYAADASCPHKMTVQVPVGQTQWQACPFHRQAVLSRSTGLRVDSRCWSLSDTVHRVVELWPSAVRSVWMAKGLDLPPEPLWAPACLGASAEAPFSISYPVSGTRLFLPRGDATGEAGFVAQVAHGQKDITLYWFLDGVALGQTTGEHSLAIRAATGVHRLVVQDGAGRKRTVRFSVRAYGST